MNTTNLPDGSKTRVGFAPHILVCDRCAARTPHSFTWHIAIVGRDRFGNERKALRFGRGRDYVAATTAPLFRCACGGIKQPNPIKAEHRADVPCDARCTHAKGFVCSCSCGGKNHGQKA